MKIQNALVRAWRIGCMLGMSAVIGVVAASVSTCGVGLVLGTDTWCGLGYVWLLGFPFAIASALVLGPPAMVIFRWLRLGRWWHFVLGGTILAAPLWFELAQPFTSPRWAESGFFDSLNYLGSGALAGLSYWVLSRHRDDFSESQP